MDGASERAPLTRNRIPCVRGAHKGRASTRGQEAFVVAFAGLSEMQDPVELINFLRDH